MSHPPFEVWMRKVPPVTSPVAIVPWNEPASRVPSGDRVGWRMPLTNWGDASAAGSSAGRTAWTRRKGSTSNKGRAVALTILLMERGWQTRRGRESTQSQVGVLVRVAPQSGYRGSLSGNGDFPMIDEKFVLLFERRVILSPTCHAHRSSPTNRSCSSPVCIGK